MNGVIINYDALCKKLRYTTPATNAAMCHEAADAIVELRAAVEVRETEVRGYMGLLDETKAALARAEAAKDAAVSLWNECGADRQEILDYVRAHVDDPALTVETLRSALRDLLNAKDNP